MAPYGNCRVCGAPSVGTMPCRRCCCLLLDRDNVKMSWDVRVRASDAIELLRIQREKGEWDAVD